MCLVYVGQIRPNFPGFLSSSAKNLAGCAKPRLAAFADAKARREAGTVAKRGSKQSDETGADGNIRWNHGQFLGHRERSARLTFTAEVSRTRHKSPRRKANYNCAGLAPM